MSLESLDLLRDGLPESKVGPRHVVIVGAGMAGLTAGLLLKNAGHKVTILEGQNRLGGRILTYRGFAGDMYGEFGAMHFPLQHTLIRPSGRVWFINDACDRRHRRSPAQRVPRRHVRRGPDRRRAQEDPP